MNQSSTASRLPMAALLVLLPMTTGACGFIFSHGPPANHQQMDYFTCTESNAGPILDVIWASLNGIGALAAAGDPDAYAYANSDGVIVVGLSWAVVSSFAAASGFSKSKRCRAARQQLAARQKQPQDDRRAPPPLDAVVQAVVVRPEADTLRASGDRIQLTATAHNSSGAIILNKVFTWSSSNDAIASVSNAGLVTAHAAGSVVIAANTDNVVGTARIVVTSGR